MAYKLSNFLANVEKVGQELEEKQKKEAIGLVINSLQRPFKELMTSVILDQHNQIQSLMEKLGWKKS